MNFLLMRFSHLSRLLIGNLVTFWMPRTPWRKELRRNITFPNQTIFVREKYYKHLGHYPDLHDPKTFNEKINWLKLHDHRPILTQVSDKFEVRSYVKNVGLEHTLNDIYGVYDDPDDIDFEALPDQFVIKTTHACKTNIICKNKTDLKLTSIKRNLRKWMGYNYYYLKAEWAYKNIKPRILIERYLEGDSEYGLVDYKFYCFNSKPMYIQVDFDRFSGITRKIYNTEWVAQPFAFNKPLAEKNIDKPKHFEQMLASAALMSRPFTFARVDFYNFPDKYIFGEITLYPAAGYGRFVPDHMDRVWGDMLKLPEKSVG